MLRLRIVGRMESEVDGAVVAMPLGERARALIGWLALHRGPQPRDDAAAALWPDAPADRARANLRTALWAVHSSWGPAGRYVVATRTRVGLAGGDVWVDATDDEPADAEALLLPGLADEWVVLARERRRRAVLERLVERAEQAEQRDRLSEAVRLSREVCRLSPLDEGAHRALLQRLLLTGDRASAIEATRDFSARLMAELGARPSVPTRAAHARARAGAVRSPRPRLFGRADEVAELANRWKEAAGGAGQVVVLTGEAGIGKSSLIADLVHRAEGSGGSVATAVGMDVAGHVPFGVWLELCEDLVASVPRVPAQATWPQELNRLSDRLGGRLGHEGAPAPVTAPELERLRVFESVLRLVEWSCASRPTLLVLDDAHRADRASLRLTTHVARRLASLPVLLVIAYRGGTRIGDLAALSAELAGRHVPVVEIELRPLDDGAIAAVATSAHPLADGAIQRVIRAADGNPLLAVESSQALASGDSGPSPSLRAAVRASCSRLPRDAARLVELLAAAGRPLTPSEIGRLGLARIDALEASAVGEGLLARSRGALGFRHELLREAVCAEIPDPVGLHATIASVIDRDRHADVAHHLSAAGRATEAAHWWAVAAADARRRGALDEAHDFLVRATEATPSDGRLWLELQEVCAWSARQGEMEIAWERVLALLPEDELAVAWCRRGRHLRSVLCRPVASVRAYTAALDLLTERSDHRLRADVLRGLAWGDVVAGGGQHYEELLADAGSWLGAAPDAGELSEVLEIEMLELIRSGRFSQAVEVAGRVPPHVLSARWPDRAFAVLMNAACALTCVGDLDGALVLVDRAVDAAAALPAVLVISLAARGRLLAGLGRHDEAAEAARRQLELAERLDGPGLAATALHDAGLVALAAGRHEDAAPLLARALAGDARVSRPIAGLRCAEALARAGDPAAARRRLRAVAREPVGPADQTWSLMPQAVFVEGLIAAAEGDPVVACGRYEAASDGWRHVVEQHLARTADDWLANLAELGRPPVLDLIDPARELARVEAARRAL